MSKSLTTCLGLAALFVVNQPIEHKPKSDQSDVEARHHADNYASSDSIASSSVPSLSPYLPTMALNSSTPASLPTPYGYCLQPQDDGVFHWFYPRLIAQQWEPYSFAIIDTCLQPNSIYIDIGTWIAPLALYALTKPGTAVLGVEPDPVARERCCANMAANQDELQCSERMILETACSASFCR